MDWRATALPVVLPLAVRSRARDRRRSAAAPANDASAYADPNGTRGSPSAQRPISP
jgi:hypothetical protein